MLPRDARTQTQTHTDTDTLTHTHTHTETETESCVWRSRNGYAIGPLSRLMMSFAFWPHALKLLMHRRRRVKRGREGEEGSEEEHAVD